MTIFSHRAIARALFVLCVGSITVSSFGENAVVLTGDRVSKREAARAARREAAEKMRREAIPKKKGVLSRCAEKVKDGARKIKGWWCRLSPARKGLVFFGVIAGLIIIPCLVFSAFALINAAMMPCVFAPTLGYSCTCNVGLTLWGLSFLAIYPICALLCTTPFLAVSLIGLSGEVYHERRAAREFARAERKQRRHCRGRFLFWSW